LLLSCIHLCNGVWVLVIQYTSHITFTDNSGFVASVPQTIVLASPEALLPCTLVLNFNFELPIP